MDRDKSLDIKRKEHIEHVLAMAQNDLDLTSRTLGLSPAALRRWMKRLGIAECTAVRKPDTGSGAKE